MIPNKIVTVDTTKNPDADGEDDDSLPNSQPLLTAQVMVFPPKLSKLTTPFNIVHLVTPAKDDKQKMTLQATKIHGSTYTSRTSTFNEDDDSQSST